jgi:phenylpyruvate tautomerase PptA (4-oxalocrotonate tautomerase family)
MATQNDSGFKTFQATSSAISKARLVKLSSSNLISVTGDENLAIGVTLEDIEASGYGAVKLFGSPGTFFVTASAAITAGAKLFPAASGKVDDATAGTGATLGLIAQEAATADGDIIEAIPFR